MILFLLACNGDDVALDDTPCEQACDAVFDCHDVYLEDEAQQQGVDVPESERARNDAMRASCKEECVIALDQEPAAADAWVECIDALPAPEDGSCLDGVTECGGAYPCTSDTPLYNWTAQGNAPEDYVCEPA